MESFKLNKMIEFLDNGNSRGIVVLWDENFLEHDEIATINQEEHAMVKVHFSNTTWLFSCIYVTPRG